MPSSIAPKGHLYVSTHGVAFLGRDLCTELHRHFTASLTVSIEGPISIRASGNQEWQSTFGLIAKPNAEQQLDPCGALVMNLQVDPETESYARLLSGVWRDAPDVLVLDEARLASLRAGLRALVDEQRTRGEALWQLTLEAFGGPAEGPPKFDERIARVLEILKAAMPEAPSTQELGRQVGLSEGRLIHLFSEQVGVPLRRYVLWLRIRHMVFCLAIGRNLTDAAHEAGFADSAHLTRIFRSMFGIAPSQLLRSEQVGISLEIPALPITGPHAVQDMARLQRVMAELSSRSKWSRP
jgi:AraC-like DNA-binding protein